MKKINIPLSDQVVERKISEKLTEKIASVGIEIRSALHWYKMPDGIYNVFLPREERFLHIDAVQICPAYTLLELLAVLPDEIEVEDKTCLAKATHKIPLNITKYCTGYWPINNPVYKICHGIVRYDGFGKENYQGINPATAAAKLLIGCIDNGYIKGGGV